MAVIFLRARSSVTMQQVASGTMTIPRQVEVGDYCIAFSIGNVAAGTVTVPAWMTRLDFADGSDSRTMSIFGGFVPDATVPGSAVTISYTGGALDFAFSASFWGGVDSVTPVSSLLDVVAASPQTLTSFTQNIVTSLVAEYFNNQTSGNALTGRVADLGGTWSLYAGGNTDTDDFTQFVGTIIYGEDPTSCALRTVVNDAATTPLYGRHVYLSSSTGAAETVSVDIRAVANHPLGRKQFRDLAAGLIGYARMGLVMRQTAHNSMLLVYYKIDPFNGAAGSIRVEKWVAGTQTVLGEFPLASSGMLIATWARLQVNVTAAGVVTVGWAQDRNGSVVTIGSTAADSALATAGSLASGTSGIYDHHTTNAGASWDYSQLRYYDNFMASSFAPVCDHVIIGAGSANYDSLSLTSNPSTAGLSALDYQTSRIDSTPAVANLGRTLVTKYIDGKANLESAVVVANGAYATEEPGLKIGYVGLNAAAEDKIVRIRKPRTAGKPWSFRLVNGADPSIVIDEIGTAINRKLSWVLSRPGSASFDVHVEDEIARSIEPLSTAIIAYKGDDAMWSGPVWTVNESTNGAMNVTCAGWQQLLDRRLIAVEHRQFSRFGSLDGAKIAAHLIAFMHERYLPSTGHILRVKKTIRATGNVMRRKSYEKFQVIGNEIVALSDTEAGFDIWVDPATMDIEFWDRLEEDRRNDVHFTFNADGQHNLQSVTRARAADKVVNGIWPLIKSDIVVSEQIDTTSRDKYGFLEETASLTEVTDPSIALAYAAGELVYRNAPLPTYTIVPMPADQSMPQPLVDYHVGSVVQFSANRGSIQVAKQAVRIFQLDLDIGENGEETVTNMSVYKS